MDLLQFVEQVENITSQLNLSRGQHLELIKGFAELKKELQKDLTPSKVASTVTEESKERNNGSI